MKYVLFEMFNISDDYVDGKGDQEFNIAYPKKKRSLLEHYG